MLTTLPQPGEILAGKYRIERLLGVGGMGVVVCAHHLQLDERVALKFLRPEALENGEAVARFDREARAAVKIKSEHVARVTDVGRLENGAPYMVMEYLEGRDLSAWIVDRGALPVEQAVEFVLQACEAIADAHALGIIHRDLKPSNLFCIVRSDGLPSIKVLDFGISKLTGLSASGAEMAMTRTQSLMGSPLYMSPEQMQTSRGVDTRTDIWALGVILFELVTSHVPFLGEGIPDLVLNIVTGPTPSVRAHRPDLPLVLDQVIQRCLEKDRANRYANVAELATALAVLAPKTAAPMVAKIARIIQNAGLATSAARTGPAAAFVASVPEPRPAATVPAWGQTAPGVRGKTTVLVSLLAVAAMASVFGLVLAARSHLRGSTPSPAATAMTATSSSALIAAPVPPALPSAAAPESDAGERLAAIPDLTTAPTATAPPSAALPAPPPRPSVRPGTGRPAAPSKPVCSAVPYLDSEGNTHFKQVCK